MALLDFFGKGGRKDLKRASRGAAENYTRGLNQFTDTVGAGKQESLGYYEPFGQAGLGAQNLYSNYLGVNGLEGRQGFFDDFQFGPELEAANEYGIRALDRSASARGLNYSGNQLENLYNFGMQNFGNFLNPYLDRLERSAGQGANIAQQQAGIASQAAQNIGDAQFGTQQLLANNQINTGNALAANRQVGMNNLLGLLGIGANVFGGLGGLGGGQQQPFVGQAQPPSTPFPWQRMG